jgi:hypothetical protein
MVVGNAGPQNTVTPAAPRLLTFVLDGKAPLEASNR